MIKVIVPISGGKDSQACMKLALESHDKQELIGLFCDTRFEHPATYEHIETIKKLYGVKIETINNGSVVEQVHKHKRFPGGGARFCTEELKIRPSIRFYKELAEQNGGFEVWLGMRANESVERSKRYKDKVSNEIFPPHELMKKYPKYLAKMGVTMRLPILDWTSYEVLYYLAGEENILYSHGFERVGCFPCLASGDRHKEKAFAFDEFGKEQRVIVSALEKRIGRSIFTSVGGHMRNNENQIDLFAGCAMCAI